MSTARTAAFTAAALVCFAANSILCRRALATDLMDPGTFTFVRIGTGAVATSLVSIPFLPGPQPSQEPAAVSARSSAGVLALFAYAAAFSLAYVRIPAAVGALVLFGCVQLTMLGWAIRRGERPTWLEWAGLAMASVGLVALSFPGLAAPDPLGVAEMAVAGVAWGVYSILGRESRAPVLDNMFNFARAMFIAAWFAFGFVATGRAHATAEGALLATASGAVASGLGYAMWYAALPGLRPTVAAIGQLTVPVLTAAAGVLFLGEPLTARTVVSGTVILAGVGTTIAVRRR